MDRNITVDPKDAQDNKIMGILAYLGILVLVPILAAKDSPFAKFHANQGLIILIAWIALNVVLFILSFIFAFVFSSFFLYRIFQLLYGLAGLGYAVLAIIGIIGANNGETKELPVVGNLITIIK